LSAPRTSIRHVPALDGLRGCALLGVLFFHANGALPGGYLGVDLFFVLSGFLITSLLLAEHRDTGRIALSSFWVRRARRLFPALLSLMPAIALYARFVATPADLAGLRGDALATLAYVANWRTILSHKSYWQLFAAPSPLEHTWSLSIEEQFYVVWPLLVVLLTRQRSGGGAARRVCIASIVLAAMSVAMTLALFNPAESSRVYLGTDTRAAGILAGAALATFVRPSTTLSAPMIRSLDVLGIVAMIGLAVAWWKLPGDSPFLYHGGLWLTEAAAMVLIVCATLGPASVVARCLAWRPLTLLGTISYGVYLWHWPVNVWLTAERLHVRGLPLQALHFALTFVIAGVSYRYLEKPILSRGLPFGRPLYIVPAAIALAVLFIVRGTYAREERPALPATLIPRDVVDLATVAPYRVLMVGDSTANSLGWALRGVQRPGAQIELRGQDGCTMLADACGGATWAQTTKEVAPKATLLVLGGAFMHGITVNGEWQKSCRPGWDAKFEETVARRLADLKSDGVHVWAVTVPYALGVWETPAFHAEVDCINTSIRRAAESVQGVQLLELAEHMCPAGNCALESHGQTIRPDGVHYSIDGALAVSQWILDEVEHASP
jgi:peptidoglycan/LPS O-acetylase OafA/YrhL